MAKMESYNKANSQLLSITFRFDKPAEIDICQKLLKDETIMKTGCPECKAIPVVSECKDFTITVHSPLSPSLFGFAVGDVETTCKCGAKMKLSMVDVLAFPEVTAFIRQLRERAKKKGK